MFREDEDTDDAIADGSAPVAIGRVECAAIHVDDKTELVLIQKRA
jgi:hypothetical protein